MGRLAPCLDIAAAGEAEAARHFQLNEETVIRLMPSGRYSNTNCLLQLQAYSAFWLGLVKYKTLLAITCDICDTYDLPTLLSPHIRCMCFECGTVIELMSSGRYSNTNSGTPYNKYKLGSFVI